MKKFAFLSIIVFTMIGLTACNQESSDTTDVSNMTFQEQKEEAILRAGLLHREKKELGEDLSHGPCLAEEIISGWSADLAHLPRTKEDDLTKNQCNKYYKGETKHFVELSIDGTLIRVQ